jgi:hypothetical protein
VHEGPRRFGAAVEEPRHQLVVRPDVRRRRGGAAEDPGVDLCFVDLCFVNLCFVGLFCVSYCWSFVALLCQSYLSILFVNLFVSILFVDLF